MECGKERKATLQQRHAVKLLSWREGKGEKADQLILGGLLKKQKQKKKKKMDSRTSMDSIRKKVQACLTYECRWQNPI